MVDYELPTESQKLSSKLRVGNCNNILPFTNILQDSSPPLNLGVQNLTQEDLLNIDGTVY